MSSIQSFETASFVISLSFNMLLLIGLVSYFMSRKQWSDRSQGGVEGPPAVDGGTRGRGDGLPAYGQSPALATGAGSGGQRQGKNLIGSVNGPVFGEGGMMLGRPSESSLIMHRFGFNNGANSARGK